MRRPTRAFSLPEILVGMTLLALVGAIVLQVYLAVIRVGTFGGARIEVQNATRLALRRMVPLVESAIPRSSTTSAIMAPPEGETGPQLEFVSTQDLLGNGVADPRNPTYFEFRIRRVGSDVWLEQTNLAPPPRRLLGKLKDLSFTNLGGVSVQIQVSAESVSARTLSGETRIEKSELTTLVYLPYYLHQPEEP